MKFKERCNKGINTKNNLSVSSKTGTEGITLIALVITIIVLLILAGISIATLMGENGILTRAQTAKNLTQEKEIEEQIKLSVMYARMNSKNDLSIDTELLEDELKSNLGTGITITKNGTDGNLPWEVTKGDYTFEIKEEGKVAVKGQEEEPGDKDPSKTTPGKPDSEGYFTEASTINGEEVSATNPKIPAGFMPIDQGNAVWGDGTSATTEDAVNEGLVIQDKNENQFVWVPVPVFTDFERIAGYYNGSKQYSTFTSTGLTDDEYYEPEGDGETVDTNASEDIQEAQEMYKSVNKNKGFYIGRYETGFESDTAKGAYTSYTTYTPENVKTETEKLVVKANAQLYNYVPWGAGVSDTSAVNKGTADNPAYVIGAVELARNFDSVNNYKGVTSILCYGVQWDAVMKWMESEPNKSVEGKTYIQDSTGMGWYENNSGYLKHKTGIDVDANASNKVKNIYDMAGNMREWTMEAYDTQSITTRGNGYTDSGSRKPVSYRDSIHPISVSEIVSFRLVLFM